jgi:hypothetical protein
MKRLGYHADILDRLVSNRPKTKQALVLGRDVPDGPRCNDSGAFFRYWGEGWIES